MIDQIVFWGLCAVLVFLPLPIGAVEEWAIFAFEAATVGLFLLQIGGRAFAKRRPGRALENRADRAGAASHEAWSPGRGLLTATALTARSSAPGGCLASSRS